MNISEKRKILLWEIFVENLGVFTIKEETSAGGQHPRQGAYMGRTSCHSETTVYKYVGEENISSEEYNWLKSRADEIPTPVGYIRVKNDANEVLPILERSDLNDNLLVIGKKDKRRRKIIWGEWYNGHPSGCNISFYRKGVERNIQSIFLNGIEQKSNYINVDRWKTPEGLATMALRAHGYKATQERVAALAAIYKEKELEIK